MRKCHSFTCKCGARSEGLDEIQGYLWPKVNTVKAEKQQSQHQKPIPYAS